MTSKLNLRLTLATVAIVVVLAIVLGLVVTLTPAVQTASAEIEIGGGWHNHTVYEWEDPADDANIAYIRVLDNTSAEYYDFFWTTSNNEPFTYSLACTADELVNTLWTVDVNTSDDFTGVDYRAGLGNTFTGYYATYDSTSDRPGEYLVGAPTKPGQYTVVIYNVSTDKPMAWVAVKLYREFGPFKVFNTEFTYGTYSGNDLIDALYSTSDYGYAKLAQDYYDEKAGYHYGAYIDDEGETMRYGRRANNNLDADSDWNKGSAYLPAGKYNMTVWWEDWSGGSAGDIGNVGDPALEIEVKPLVVNETYGSSQFTRTWGDYDLDFYQPMAIDTNPNAQLEWWYDDGSEDGAKLPSGLDLQPGNYSVWPVLTGSDVEAGNVVIGRIDVDMDEANKANPATLVINPIDLTYSIANDAFSGLTYGDAMSFGFKTNVYTNETARTATAVSNWGAIDYYVRWYYEDAEGKHDFDEFCPAGTYTLKYEYLGSQVYGFETGLTKNGDSFFDDENPIRVTIKKASVTDATVYIGTEPSSMPLIMFTGDYIEASHLNELYYVPTGLKFSVKSMSDPAAKFAFDGWKRNPDDDEEEPVTDLSELIGNNVYFAYNIYAVKNVGTEEEPEWVKDTNYNVDQLSCAVRINRRRIQIVPDVSMLFYDGTEQVPGFTVQGVDSYLNPNEPAAPEFRIDDPWTVLAEADNIIKGTNAGSGYDYGVQVLDDTRFIIDDMGSLHLAYTWPYSIEQMHPTFEFTKLQDWFYTEAIMVHAGSEYDDFMEYMAKKISIELVTTGLEGDEVELNFVQWTVNDYDWYAPAEDKFDTDVANYIGKTITFEFGNSESLSGNVASWSDKYSFTVAKAPVYFIYNDSAVTLNPTTLNLQAVAWYDWTAVLFNREDGIAVETRMEFSVDYDMNSDLNHDDFFELTSGSNGAKFAGEYNFTIGFSTASSTMISDYYEIMNPEVTFTIPWNMVTVEKFDLPTDFTYGGEDGNSYYQTPFVDFVGESDIIGATDGFGEAAMTFRIPYETWEFRTSTEDPWTLWTDVNYPKDVGVYLVRYSAVFYNVTAGQYEWNDTTGKWDVYLNEEDGFGNKTSDKGVFKLDYVEGTFRINPRDLTLQWTGLDNMYNGLGHMANANATMAYGEAFDEWVAYTQDSYTDYQEGGYALTAAFKKTNSLGNDNYNLVNPAATLYVNKIKATVVADDVNEIYGWAPTYTYRIEGLVNEETEASLRTAGDLTGYPYIHSSYAQYSDVGEYGIVCEDSNLWALNYEFEFQDGTLTIAKHSLTVSIGQNAYYVYIGEAQAAFSTTGFNVYPDTLREQDNALLTYKFSKTAGDYSADYPTWTDAGDYTVYFEVTSTNYETYTGSYTFTLAKATIQGYIRQSKTLTYNGAEQGGSAALDDTIATVAARDTASIVKQYKTSIDGAWGGLPTFIDAGTHGIWFKVTADNHEDMQDYYEIAIDPVTVTYKFMIDGEETTSAETTGSDHTVTATITNRFGSDDVSIELSGDTVKSEKGNYVANLTLIGAAKANYLFANGDDTTSVNWAIGFATITGVSVVQSGTVIYNGTATAAASVDTAAITKHGEDAVFYYRKSEADDWSTSIPVFTTAGAHTVYYMVTAENHSAFGGNDSDKFTVVVSARPITVGLSGDGSHFTYGDDDSTFVAGNLVALNDTSLGVGDTFADVANFEFNLTGSTQAGTYNVSVISLGNANYDFTGATAQYIIDARTLRFDWSHTGDLIYNGSEQKPTVAAKAEDVKNGDSISITLSEGKVNAGNGYTITVTEIGNANYVIDNATKSTTFSISPRPTFVTIDNKESVYNKTLAVLSSAAAVSDGYYPTVANDGAQGQIWSLYFKKNGVEVNLDKTSDVGEYEICGRTLNNNYAVTFENGVYTMLSATITNVTIAQDGVLTYNGVAQQPALKNVSAKTQNSEDWEFWYSATEDGTYTTTVPTAYTYAVNAVNRLYYVVKAANHSDTAPAYIDVTVNARPITVTINAKDSFYGDAQVALDAVATFKNSFNDGKNVIVDGELPYALACEVNGKSHTGAYSITGSCVNFNYDITFVAGTYTVNKKVVTPKFYVDGAEVTEAIALSYDGVEHTFVVKAAGVNGQTITIAEDEWTDPQGSTEFVVSAQALYADDEFDYADYEMADYNVPDYSIVKREITVEGTLDANLTKVYGNLEGLDQPFSYVQLATGSTLAVGDELADVITVTLATKLTNGDEVVFAPVAGLSDVWNVNKYYLYVINLDTDHYVINEEETYAVGILDEDVDYLDVVARKLTVTVDAKTSVYGEEPAALTAVIAAAEDDEIAVVGEDATPYSLVCAAVATSAVGAYDITGSCIDANYAITFVGQAGAYTITNATLTGISAAQSGTLTYDGTEQAATVSTAATSVNEQAVAFTYSKAADGTFSASVPSFKDVGEYTVYYKVNAANHNEATGSFQVTIVNAEFANVSVSQAAALTYNAAEQVATVTKVAGTKIEADVAAFTFAKAANGTFAADVPSFKDAGEYTVYYKVNLVNYNEATGSFKVTIGKKALTVKADDKSITYGDYKPTYTESYEGFAGSEDKAVLGGELTLTCTYEQFKSAAGKYDIVPAGLTSDNYAITFTKGTLTVAEGEFETVEVKDGGKVEVEVDAAAASSVEGVDINKIIEAAAKAGDNAGLTLTVGEGNKASSIVLNAAAVKALAGKDVKIAYTVKEGADAADAIKGAELVLDITLSGMTDGTATITVPFANNAPGGKVAKIFYVDENGKKTDMKGVFENGTVTFTTDHNSTYMVSYVLSIGSIVGIVIAAVAVVAIVIVLVIVLGKKKKAPAAKEEAPAKSEEAEETDSTDAE